MGTAVEHPVPDRVKPSYVIFFTALSPERHSARMSKNYELRLNPLWYKMLYSCTHKATVGFNRLIIAYIKRELITYTYMYCDQLRS